MKIQLLILLAFSFVSFQSCFEASKEEEKPSFIQELRDLRRKIPRFGTSSDQKDSVDLTSLIPLHQPMNASNITDWERRFQSEPQDLTTYLGANPIHPTIERPFIYVGKLGDFSLAQNEIFQLTCLYLQAFFGCEVRLLDSIPMSEIPTHAKRVKGGNTQLYTRYLLNEILKPRIPDLSQESFNLCLKRTLKTAAHETGHMFSMKHCTFYFCTMQGAYHLEEADERPMYVCPTCLSKIASAGHIDIRERFEYLERFWTVWGFEKESSEYKRFINAIDF